MSGWLKANRDIVLIVSVAFVLRVSLVGWLHELRGYTGDEKEYISLAKNLTEGKPFVDSNGEWSTRAPLFPYMLAGLFVVFGDSMPAVHVAGCLLGALIVWLGFLLSRQLFSNRTFSLVSAGILAVYPGLIVYADLVQTETVYIVFVLIAFLGLYRFIEEPTIANVAALGVGSGLASLTRAVFVGFFPVMILVLIWMKRRNFMRTLLPVVAVTIVYCSVLAPWTLRNFAVHGTLIPVSSGGGNSFLTGNNPYATGTWRTKEGFEGWFAGQARQLGIEDVTALTETQRNSLSGTIARRFIVEQSSMAATIAVKKAYMFWVFPITNSDAYVPNQLAALVADATLLLLVGAGAAATWKHRRVLAPLSAAIVFFFCVHVVLHCESRFRLPLIPLLAVCAGPAGAVMFNKQSLRDFFHITQNTKAALITLAVVVLVYAFTGFLFVRHSI